jgi:hypothetical protein
MVPSRPVFLTRWVATRMELAKDSVNIYLKHLIETIFGVLLLNASNPGKFVPIKFA